MFWGCFCVSFATIASRYQTQGWCVCVLWLRPSLSQPATSPSALCQLLSSQVHLTSLQLWSLAWSSWIQLQLVGGTPGASLQAKGSKCGSWQSWRPALWLPFPGTLPLQGSKKSISTSLLGTGARSKAWRGSQLAKPEPRRTHAFIRVPPQHLLVLALDLYSSEMFVYTALRYVARCDTLCITHMCLFIPMLPMPQC